MSRVTLRPCAHEFFAKGEVQGKPEAVSASAWIDGAEDDEEVMEHLFPMPLGMAMSLVWWKS
jgi:hypothetical protein